MWALGCQSCYSNLQSKVPKTYSIFLSARAHCVRSTGSVRGCIHSHAFRREFALLLLLLALILWIYYYCNVKLPLLLSGRWRISLVEKTLLQTLINRSMTVCGIVPSQQVAVPCMLHVFILRRLIQYSIIVHVKKRYSIGAIHRGQELVRNSRAVSMSTYLSSPGVRRFGLADLSFLPSIQVLQVRYHPVMGSARIHSSRL